MRLLVVVLRAATRGVKRGCARAAPLCTGLSRNICFNQFLRFQVHIRNSTEQQLFVTEEFDKCWQTIIHQYKTNELK